MIVSTSWRGNNVYRQQRFVSLGIGAIQMQILLLDIMNFVTIKYVSSNYVTANFVNYAIADVYTAMSLPT